MFSEVTMVFQEAFGSNLVAQLAIEQEQNCHEKSPEEATRFSQCNTQAKYGIVTSAKSDGWSPESQRSVRERLSDTGGSKSNNKSGSPHFGGGPIY
jgi:hypothetical protein